MTSLSEIRDRALATGLNAVAPVYSKMASTVNDLSETKVGRAVVHTTGRTVGLGLELAAPVVERVAQMVGGEARREDSEPVAMPPTETRAAAKTSAKSATATATAAKTGTKKTGNKIGTKKTPKSKGPASKSAATSKSRGGAAGSPTASRKIIEDPPSPPTPVAPVPGAVSRTGAGSAEVPLPGYDALAPEQIVARLEGLTQSELASVYRYEKAHGERPAVLEAIDDRLVALPLPTYDSLEVSGVLVAINPLTAGELRILRDYEAATKDRLPILEKIDALLEGLPS